VALQAGAVEAHIVCQSPLNDGKGVDREPWMQDLTAGANFVRGSDRLAGAHAQCGRCHVLVAGKNYWTSLGAAAAFKVGDKVRMKDNGDLAYAAGVVVSTSPLKVKPLHPSDVKKGFSYDSVVEEVPNGDVCCELCVEEELYSTEPPSRRDMAAIRIYNRDHGGLPPQTPGSNELEVLRWETGKAVRSAPLLC